MLCDLMIALYALIIEGDYTSTLTTYGFEEDHPYIDTILTITGK